MGIVFNIMVSGLFYLACIGMDIAIFFLLIRLVLMWRSDSWLEQLNEVGRQLVDALAAKVGRLWFRAVRKQLSCRGELLVGLTVLLFVRLTVCEVARLL
jgi:hypothetical protein